MTPFKPFCLLIAMLWSIMVIPTHANNTSDSSNTPNNPASTLTLQEANKLAQLPLHCIEIEYPNKPGQVLNTAADLASPKKLHPAFYGCFDWHSAVHGHWSLVRLLKLYPDLTSAKQIKAALLRNISAANIATEIKYFHTANNTSFERPYGWAWLLKLAEELHTWDDPLAKTLEKNLQPLTTLITQRFKAYLPKLHYPIRVGTHTNTAFAMSFAWDYAVRLQDTEFKEVIKQRALDFFDKDRNCPLGWEPSGYDFLSPCLEELNIMQRVLSSTEFSTWLEGFLPQLKNPQFTLPVAEVSDRKDGHLVHLDGLNFSRAWCLYDLNTVSSQYKHLAPIANKHMSHSLPNLIGDSYEGSHWLGSFAIYALSRSHP